MNRRVYSHRYRGILNFLKRRFNLRRQLISIVGVLIILILLLFLKMINNSISDNIIQIIENSINYEFSLKKDGQVILDYGKRFLKLPERALSVFNVMNSTKYPSPIDGAIYKPFGEIKYIDGTTDYNNGIDIIPKNDVDPVAIEKGIVAKIEDRNTKGYFVTIEHEDFVTVYGYLTKVYVSEREEIARGTKIGTLGTNKDGNKYLHFEILVDNTPVNPLDYIELGN